MRPSATRNLAIFASFSSSIAMVGCRAESSSPMHAAISPPAAAEAPVAESSPRGSVDGGADVAITAQDPFDASLDLPSLTESDAMTDLSVPKAKNARAAVPLGAVRPRPVLVALHGNFDRPEWTCDVWTYVADGFPFVLCPRGTSRKDAAPGDDRWTYAGSTAAGRELDGVITAAGSRWGAYVHDGPIVYAGFSLGAILGVPIVAADPARFPRVILVEGGHDGWTDARAAAFAAGAHKIPIGQTDGGVFEPRVLFVCAQAGCTADAEPARKILVRHGVGARIVSAGNVGHQYGGVVAETTKKSFAWITENMPGWPQTGPQTGPRAIAD